MGDLIKEVQLSREDVRELKFEIRRLHERQRVIEKGLCPANPGLSELLGAHDEETRNIKKEDEADDIYNELRRPAKMRKADTNGVTFTQPEGGLEDDMADSDDGSENHAAANVPPGEPAIPIGHTTGAAKILEWQAVAAMVGERMKRDKNRGMNPLERERKRGVIRLYGRGEARPEAGGRSLGTELDSISDYGLEPPRSSSDSYSDLAHSPIVEQAWGQGGAQSPVADALLFRAESDARAAVDMTGLPSLDEKTVRHLAGIYMRHLNVMHPIITPKSLEGMIGKFMQNIGGAERDGAGYSNFSTFAGNSDATGTKRKRSPTASGIEYTFDQQIGQGLRQRTISEGIVLLILALGKICEHQTKIPDVVPDNDGSTTNSPANHVSPPILHQSPQMSSHSSTLPSPVMQDRAHNRRGSTALPGTRYPPGTRNLDVIPGLAYFAAGMDILGHYRGGTGLPYVHACLLAGLYHSQLGRVLQSHVYVMEAGYTLSIMLKP